MKNSIVQGVKTAEFIYHPPKIALTAKRILVKPNLGYPVGPPVTVSLPILTTVLQTLRHQNPQAEILIVEGVCSPVSLDEIVRRHGIDQILGDGIRILDADTLPLTEYPNLSPQPVRFKSMFAPSLLTEVDCRISIGAFKRTILNGKPLISASLKNLYGLFPRAHYHARSPHSRGQLHRPSVPLILQDVYFCIGHLFDGAVVDGDRQFISPNWKPDRGESIPLGKVFWGEDLISVDREVCNCAGEIIPDYLDRIDQLRQSKITPT
ncbi:MAG: hypothetical protein AUK43_18100 [Oscillatoriales cyanobacterium CG2_30_40_61]|nr:MAG: hypothetical protein AUK43_18100 [Oscillatoriales cyanobacterium CG2_30_40_61]